MKYIAYIIICLATLVGCSPSQESLIEEIKAFEKSEKTGTKEGLAELAKMHKNYGLNYSDKGANDYLYASGLYYFHENKLGESKPLLEEYITRDDSTIRYRNAAVNLATIYSKATEWIKVDEIVSELLDKKAPSAAQWQEIIELYKGKINAVESSASDYDKLSRAYRNVGRFEEAIATLETAITKFPKDDKRENFMYTAGFVAWENLKNSQLAEKYYTQFITEYPEDEKVDDAKQILNSGMLNMSDEAILDMLKAKNNG